MSLKFENIDALRALTLLIVFGAIFIPISIVLMGQAIGKTIESVMILHDFFTVLAIMSGAGFVGLLAFGSYLKQVHINAVNVLKILVLTATAAVFLIELTGTIGYVEYRLPDPDSAKSKIKEIFPFAHEPMFETMEYLGLLGTMWTGLLTYLTFHFNEKIFSERSIRGTMMVLIFIAVVYALVISLFGIVPTKIASVQG